MADRRAEKDIRQGTDPTIDPNPELEMRPTFPSIPQELRDNILAEVQSIDNNTSFDVYNDFVQPPSRIDLESQEVRLDFALLPPAPHERKVEWDISSSLFLTGKQLSHEALGSFHRENILISIQTVGYCFIKNCASQVIPLHQTAQREKDVALHIKLCFSDRQKTAAAAEGADTEFAVMAARHLPVLIQLINTISITRERVGDRPRENDLYFIRLTETSLDFNTGSKYYSTDSRNISGRIVDDLKGMRQFRWPLWYGPNGRLAWSEAKERNIVVNGLSAKKTEELLAASNLPCWEVFDYINEAKRLKAQGDCLSKDCRYADARTAYILSAWMITEQPVPRRKIFNHSLFDTRDLYGHKLLLAAWSGAARVGAKLSLNSIEVEALDVSLRALLKGILSATRYGPILQEVILVAYGHELLKHNEYDRFVQVFRAAIMYNIEEHFIARSKVYSEMGFTLEGSEQQRDVFISNCENHIERCQEAKQQWLAGAGGLEMFEFSPSYLNIEILP